ncbi:hypothetical protein SAFG77S_08223 [Streptomyces afghaniensis]
MAEDRCGQRMHIRTAVGQRVLQRRVVDLGAVAARNAHRAADGVGEPVEVAPAVDLPVQGAERGGAEVGREPAAVEPLQRGAVRQQRDASAGGRGELPGRGGGEHAALRVPGDDQPSAGGAGPGRDPPGQVGHRALGVAGRGEGVGGARPEGAHVPQDADGAPRGGALVGAPPPGDEQDEADRDQPGAQRLGRLRGTAHHVRTARGLTRRLTGRQGTDQSPGPEQQRGGGGHGDDERGPVGERGHRAHGRDTAGALGVGHLARVVVVHDGLLDAGQSPGAPGRPGAERQQHDQQRRDHGRLPGQQDRRSVDRRPRAVQPVRHPLGNAPRHHPTQRAGQHRDRRTALSTQHCPPVGTGAVQDAGDHSEDDHEQALDQGDTTEDRVPRQPARRLPPPALPARVHEGEREQDQGGERQQSYHVLVECQVRTPLAAAPAAHHPHHGHRTDDERALQQHAQHFQDDRTARLAVVPGRGAADRGGDRQQTGGGVRGAQPCHQATPVPETGPAQRRVSVGLGLVGLGGVGHRLLGLVRPPGPQGQVPEQAGQSHGHQRGEGESAAGRTPPAAAAGRGRQEAQPGAPLGARAGARALPRHQIQSHLAGRRDEQHRQGQCHQPHQQPEQADRPPAPLGRGPHPVGEVDHHEGQQQQPQRARAVAGGEVPPDVGLANQAVPALGLRLRVHVVGAAEDGRDVVAGDPHRARIVQHLLRRGAAHPVDQEFQGGPRLLRPPLGARGGQGVPRRCGLRRRGGRAGAPGEVRPLPAGPFPGLEVLGGLEGAGEQRACGSRQGVPGPEHGGSALGRHGQDVQQVLHAFDAAVHLGHAVLGRRGDDQGFERPGMVVSPHSDLLPAHRRESARIRAGPAVVALSACRPEQGERRTQAEVETTTAAVREPGPPESLPRVRTRSRPVVVVRGDGAQTGEGERLVESGPGGVQHEFEGLAGRFPPAALGEDGGQSVVHGSPVPPGHALGRDPLGGGGQSSVLFRAGSRLSQQRHPVGEVPGGGGVREERVVVGQSRHRLPEGREGRLVSCHRPLGDAQPPLPPRLRALRHRRPRRPADARAASEGPSVAPRRRPPAVSQRTPPTPGCAVGKDQRW